MSSPRHETILNRLHRDGSVDVAALASELDTSQITIRRDLEQLAAAGVLRRVRGGAVSLMMRGEGMPFAMREIEASSVKERMAAAAAGLIRDGEAVAIDSGTTGAAAAKELAGRRLVAMPLSVQAIALLATSSTVHLLLPGGSVRTEEGSIVGPQAEASLRSLRFDTAVLTCCAVSLNDGIMAHDVQDAAVKQGMIAAARRTILLAEGAKFSRSALAVVSPLTGVDVLVTDGEAPEPVLQLLSAEGVQVIVV
jgi:DeoR/GlpR family transcriptional regulator of sugar metabolism